MQSGEQCDVSTHGDLYDTYMGHVYYPVYIFCNV